MAENQSIGSNKNARMTRVSPGGQTKRASVQMTGVSPGMPKFNRTTKNLTGLDEEDESNRNTIAANSSCSPNNGGGPQQSPNNKSGGHHQFHHPTEKPISYIISQKMCDSKLFVSLSMALTLYALFGEDMRIAFTAQKDDHIFDAMTTICLTVFSVEIVAQTIAKEDYYLGFFFFLDVIATISLVLDFTFVQEHLYGDSEGGQDGGVLRAGRASRAGTRAGRVVRLIRFIRLMRLIKMYRQGKQDEQKRLEAKTAPGTTNVVEENHDVEDENEEEDESDQHESRVGKKLSEMTTRRVIVLVIIMLLTVPNLQATSFFEELPSSAIYGADDLMLNYYNWHASRGQSNEVLVRDHYEKSLLKYIYYHNYFTKSCGSSGSCSADYYHKLYYIKIEGSGRVEGHVPIAFSYNHANSISNQNYEGNYQGTTGGTTNNTSQEANNTTSSGSSSSSGSNSITPLQSGFPTRETTLDLWTYFHIGAVPELDMNTDTSLWDARYGGQNWGYSMGTLPPAFKQALTKPFPLGHADGCPNDFASLSFLLFNSKDMSECFDSNCKCSTDLRWNERAKIKPTVQDRNQVSYVMFVFDTRNESRLEASLNMFQTVFVCLMLMFGALAFSKDATDLVLNPVERMINKVQRIKENPINAIYLADQDLKLELAQEEKRKDTKRFHFFEKVIPNGLKKYIPGFVTNYFTGGSSGTTVRKEPLETQILEKTIIKIGGLLAIGLGEAGAEIIGQNMSLGESAVLDAMVSGRKVDAILCYCDIRNFSEATEILQDAVMLFVNQIAQVIHSCTDEWLGSPNKNVGDAFLLVWRIDFENLDYIGDFSLMALTMMVVSIHTSSILAEYRTHDGMIAKMPNYRVRIGFGMHRGTAIEGAIGSEFKIDASYLGPTVNMTVRLESATKLYGTLVLFSHNLVELMSPTIYKLLRDLDSVIIQGSDQPLRIFTIDLDYMSLEVKPPAQGKPLSKFQQRQKRQAEKLYKLSEHFTASDLWTQDEDLMTMRRKYPAVFLQTYKMAILNYRSGEWEVAKRLLERAMSETVEGSDGPSMSILNYIKNQDYQAPKGWPGHRVLEN